MQSAVESAQIATSAGVSDGYGVDLAASSPTFIYSRRNFY